MEYALTPTPSPTSGRGGGGEGWKGNKEIYGW